MDDVVRVLWDLVMPKGRGLLPAITHDRAASRATNDDNSNFMFIVAVNLQNVSDVFMLSILPISDFFSVQCRFTFNVEVPA